MSLVFIWMFTLPKRTYLRLKPYLNSNLFVYLIVYFKFAFSFDSILLLRLKHDLKSSLLMFVNVYFWIRVSFACILFDIPLFTLPEWICARPLFMISCFPFGMHFLKVVLLRRYVMSSSLHCLFSFHKMRLRPLFNSFSFYNNDFLLLASVPTVNELRVP